MRHHEKIILFILASLTAKAVFAELTSNDPQFSITPTEAITFVEDKVNCCYDDYWIGLDETSSFSSKNYKFPLSDQQTLYMVMNIFGPHTHWYRVFLKDQSGNAKLVSFPIPQELFSAYGNKEYIDEAFNPTFDIKTKELRMWDFSHAGDNSIHITYQYNRVDGFTLKELKQDTLVDGQVFFDQQILY